MIPKTTWRKQGDIDILMMGEVAVGRINPPSKAWIFNLNSPSCFWKGEKTEALARAALFSAFNAWLMRAGISRPDQGDLFQAPPPPKPDDGKLTIAVEALVQAKREMWMIARNQWTMADFKSWAVIQQIDAALAVARST